MVMLDAFSKGDVYIDFPYEDAKFRWESATEKVYRRWYGQKEIEIHHSSDIFNQAISAGKANQPRGVLPRLERNWRQPIL